MAFLPLLYLHQSLAAGLLMFLLRHSSLFSLFPRQIFHSSHCPHITQLKPRSYLVHFISLAPVTYARNETHVILFPRISLNTMNSCKNIESFQAFVSIDYSPLIVIFLSVQKCSLFFSYLIVFILWRFFFLLKAIPVTCDIWIRVAYVLLDFLVVLIPQANCKRDTWQIYIIRITYIITWDVCVYKRLSESKFNCALNHLWRHLKLQETLWAITSPGWESLKSSLTLVLIL